MMRLWPWAVEQYARPGAAEACLKLQDEHGQSIPLLLWVLWSGVQGRAPDVEAGARTARAWEDEAVGPLRRLRRALKALEADADREAVRDQVKAVELDAERRLLNTLERLPALPGPASPPSALLAATAAAFGAPVPPESLEGLLRALNPGPA